MTKKQVNESIRIAKEGIGECWDDMAGVTGQTPEGQGEGPMTVTINMPGKNISVTTDSADEIANILKLAGIQVGGMSADGAAEAPAEMPAEEPAVMYVGAEPTVPAEQVPGDVDGDGDHDMADHEAEEESDDEESDDEEETKEAVGDTSYTSKGGKVTQTATGLTHQAGSGVYGGTETDEEEAARKKADDEAAKKEVGESEELDEESARILQLAGVTNEAQSAAQKAAFAKMIAKKNGKDSAGDDTDDMASDKGDNKKPDEDGDGVPDWADKDKEVKEEAPATNSIFGQGVYEGEAAPHDYIDYVNAGGEEPSPELINKPGVEYNPESGIISVRNSTSLTDTHRSLEAAGWQKYALAARRNPAGAGQARQAGDTAYQLESARILALAGVSEGKLMNSPAGTSMDEPTVYDSLPSGNGTGKGRPDFGANRANGQGENPMGDGSHTVSVEEQFERAMGEYRKFVSESIARKK